MFSALMKVREKDFCIALAVKRQKCRDTALFKVFTRTYKNENPDGSFSMRGHNTHACTRVTRTRNANGAPKITCSPSLARAVDFTCDFFPRKDIRVLAI